MPRNGSGVFTPSEDFTTEAASPPIEIAKLDDCLSDMGDAITASIAADGQTNPTADLKMNGFRHTNVGAATALTQYGRVTEIIDQDYTYYVDTGAADAYVITPSPAIAAYEEGQKFCFRAAHGNTTASTLNVNGIGAITIKTPDGAALTAGAIVTGGYYEVVYDENTSPDRWVLMSPTSLAGPTNIALLNAANVFTNSGIALTLNGAQPQIEFIRSIGTATQWDIYCPAGSTDLRILVGSVDRFKFLANGGFYAATGGFTVDSAGTLLTPNLTADEVGYKGIPPNSQSANYTTVLTDAGKAIVHPSGGGAGDTFTIAANGSVAYPLSTVLTFVNADSNSISIAITTDTLTLAGTTTTGTRTLAQNGVATAIKVASTSWLISGVALS